MGVANKSSRLFRRMDGKWYSMVSRSQFGHPSEIGTLNAGRIISLRRAKPSKLFQLNNARNFKVKDAFRPILFLGRRSFKSVEDLETLQD